MHQARLVPALPERTASTVGPVGISNVVPPPAASAAKCHPSSRASRAGARDWSSRRRREASRRNDAGPVPGGRDRRHNRHRRRSRRFGCSPAARYGRKYRLSFNHSDPFCGPLLCSHHSRNRTLIRQCNRRMAKLARPRDQLLGMRCAAQETEVGKAVQLGVLQLYAPATRLAFERWFVIQRLPDRLDIVKFTRYFEAMRLRPDRATIKEEWIRLVIDRPAKDDTCG